MNSNPTPEDALPIVEEANKEGIAHSSIPPTYSIQLNVGRARYVVNFHDGKKAHRDGSPFFDVRTFSRKQRMDAFVRDLRRSGYSGSK